VFFRIHGAVTEKIERHFSSGEREQVSMAASLDNLRRFLELPPRPAS
jgi:hypothetical protein